MSVTNHRKNTKLMTTIKGMKKKKRRIMFNKITRAMDMRLLSWGHLHFALYFSVVILLPFYGILSNVSAQTSLQSKYSQLLQHQMDNDDTFKPFVPIPIDSKYIQNHSHLLIADSSTKVSIQYKEASNSIENDTIQHRRTSLRMHSPKNETNSHFNEAQNETSLLEDFQDLGILLFRYIDCFLGEATILTNSIDSNSVNDCKGMNYRDQLLSQRNNISTSRAMQSGRLLFFAGLKKILWPIFIGIQIFKSLLFAMFLPTIIGSFGKILGKGIPSISSFNQPSDTVDDLQFQDNMFDLGNNYNNNKNNNENYVFHADDLYDSTSDFSMTQNQKPSRFGGNDANKHTAPQGTMYNFNEFSNDAMADGNMNSFHNFQKIPISALLLSNYDPFYSPLLSRLDSVFMQLKLNSGKEECREKLICLMYANPVKYAPYSNLVSAQLSRELNELRKPTSDNPSILRFFKYMRAAKDGQDGIDCEKRYETCTEFKDYTDPAMISAFYDIDKLVHARKMI